MRSLHHFNLLSLTIVLMLFSAAAFAQDATSYPELPRFHQVSDRLYRGAQPGPGGIRRLRELGVDTIVNLRGPGNQTKADEAEARALGFNYFNIALPNWGRPEDAQVHRILLIIAAPQNGRVFVHCKDGVDRTGMIVALHRITHQGWTTEDALAEAERRGMRRIQFWMRDYAEDYGRRAQTTNAYVPDTDLGDRIGTGMRILERKTFRIRKVGANLLRRAPGKIGGFLDGVF